MGSERVGRRAAISPARFLLSPSRNRIWLITLPTGSSLPSRVSQIGPRDGAVSAKSHLFNVISTGFVLVTACPSTLDPAQAFLLISCFRKRLYLWDTNIQNVHLSVRLSLRILPQSQIKSPRTALVQNLSVF